MHARPLRHVRVPATALLIPLLSSWLHVQRVKSNLLNKYIANIQNVYLIVIKSDQSLWYHSSGYIKCNLYINYLDHDEWSHAD